MRRQSRQLARMQHPVSTALFATAPMLLVLLSVISAGALGRCMMNAWTTLAGSAKLVVAGFAQNAKPENVATVMLRMFVGIAPPPRFASAHGQSVDKFVGADHL
mmetsp:Transcript_6465/g.14132  ORF Transcript_6465/g.14132 Transcript_6465/m.14132 type:complete len:104 (+) Transcript_6465:199-510(+)